MDRPTSLEHHRWVGDKRTQIVYDLDRLDDDRETAKAVADIVATAQFATFGPDTLVEAENRCYRPHRSVTAAAAEPP